MQVKGNGSVYEVKPGVYQYRFNLGRDPESGKYRYSPKRTLHCNSKNKRGREAELRTALEQYKQELENGVVTSNPSVLTVSEYADKFHKSREHTLGSPLSWKREKPIIDHIKELFGDIKLTALKSVHIKAAYENVRETGRFSENALHKIHATLSKIMKEAVNDELIDKNPCSCISVPRPSPGEREALTAEKTARLVTELEKENLNSHTVGTFLLIDTGMRRSEMTGLTWGDIDFPNSSVSITKQYAADADLRKPKTRKSSRPVALSSGMMRVLQAWAPIQAKDLCEIAIEQSKDTPIVSNELGGHMDPNNYSRWFRGWCVEHGFGEYSNETEQYIDSQGRKRTRRSGYKGLTPHMLRHTQATLLLSANADPNTVQRRLGHSTLAITTDTYGHNVSKNEHEAAETFASILASAKKQRD